ncbi:MAG: hypothetical protein MJ107_02025 [Lachnospiraceae bacterium]|nr:hypothetical protein [Lachnospiraceae bacterium]
MKPKYWAIGWLTIVVLGLGFLGIWVYKVDPFMHYHKPDTTKYFYTLDNQRSQNDGITKHFEYNAMITGTSMTENFKTSDMDVIFDCKSIKVPYSGGTYKETNENLIVAVENNPNLEIVVRGLDMWMFFDSKDRMRTDLGDFPTFLYDSKPLNDVLYIWNRDIIWSRVYPIAEARSQDGFAPGITSFDEYSSWQYENSFGMREVCQNGIEDIAKGKPIHLSEAEKKTIEGNVSQNVIQIAKENPNITFYYFFTPYSAIWWKNLVVKGDIYKQIEAEEYIIEMILQCDNIRLFSFNNRLDITGNINNYKDTIHYGQWINSLILRWMHDGKYELTEDNYAEYLETELNNYLNFEYSKLNSQVDYESDFYIAALLNQEFSGVQPVDLLGTNRENLHLYSANIVEGQCDNTCGIECIGNLQHETEISAKGYAESEEYIGATIEVENVDDYGYLTFYGKTLSTGSQPIVCVIDENGEIVGELPYNCYDIDNEWHQYVIDMTAINGKVQIIFGCEYEASVGRPEPVYMYSKIIMY